MRDEFCYKSSGAVEEGRGSRSRKGEGVTTSVGLGVSLEPVWFDYEKKRDKTLLHRGRSISRCPEQVITEIEGPKILAGQGGLTIVQEVGRLYGRQKERWSTADQSPLGKGVV